MAATRSRASTPERAPGALAARRRRWGARLAAGVALALALPAAAQPTDAEREAAMVQTVVDQLAAFRRGDFGAAYRFASAAIQAQFTPEAFRQMVERGYAPIAHPARSSVVATRLLGPDRGAVEIRVEGEDGETVDALYELVEEQGAWRIDGVRSTPTKPGVTASRRPTVTPAALASRTPAHR